MPLVDVLIPTCRRKTGLAVVLASLLGQTFTDFAVTISDQTPDDEVYLDDVEIQTAIRALRWRGHRVALHRHLPARGLAEQRHFLLQQSEAPYVHFLDDDVLLEPQVMERMQRTIRREACGFVGCPATGLEYLADVRSEQQGIELWEGPVAPERFTPETIPWDRHLVNNAANPLHLERRLAPGGRLVRYKVAWVGGANVLYDREKLLAVGGFSWWRRLPPNHAGEEVVVQFMLLRYYGGCGLLPSGTYHLGLPTNVPDRAHNATALFGDLIAEHEARLGFSHPQSLAHRDRRGERAVFPSPRGLVADEATSLDGQP
ncbi:MAG TPA: glycosyltransferase family A protein [Thermomicrobiales bacterium]|nr:glycosyltransferase family A protein [Thermomicrobiales bacterium]